MQFHCGFPPETAHYIIFLYKPAWLERGAAIFLGRKPRPLLCNSTFPRSITMRTHSIAAIPADGIGPEVISAGIRVLEALARREGDLGFTFKIFDWGSDYYRKHGVMMPADGLAELKHF